jgi:hypothetical protein
LAASPAPRPLEGEGRRPTLARGAASVAALKACPASTARQWNRPDRGARAAIAPEQILASHPRVFGGGELKVFEQATAGVGPALRDSSLYPEMALRMSSEHFHALGTRYLAEIRRLASAASHITDKMPSNFLFAGLIHLALPNAIIIHTIRDPVDTCVSCFSKLFTEEQNHTYDLAELGRYYQHYQALMEHWHRVLPPGRILDVRYEDVVANLEGQARRIVAHCGLERNARCLALHQTKRPVRTASATQVRKPIYKSAIGRWLVHEASLMPLLDELPCAIRAHPKHTNASIAAANDPGA